MDNSRKKKYKVLLVIRRTEYFHYCKSIVREIVGRGHMLTVLFDKEFSQTKSFRRIDEFKKRENIHFKYGWAHSHKNLFGEALFYTRDLISYRSYLKNPDIKKLAPFKKDWYDHMPVLIRQLFRVPIVREIMSGAPSMFLLRLLERVAPPSKKVVRHIRQINPDVVLVSPVTMRGSSAEVEYLKAAKALKIPTALQVISWDNLTARGLIHIKPDCVLAWNEVQRDEAIRYHNILPESVRIVGAPCFDGWFRSLRPSQTREEFCRRHGLSLEDPILLYLGSSKNIARDERWLIKKLRDAFRASTNPKVRNMQIIVRPHPGYWKRYYDFRDDGIVVLPREGELPDEDKALQLFYDTLHYSVAVVEINTSGIIDALIAGKPGIALITKEYEKVQDGTIHFRQLIDADALERAFSPEECVRVIEEIMKGKDTKREQREAFVRRFVRPRGLGVSAGEAVADEVEKLALNLICDIN